MNIQSFIYGIITGGIGLEAMKTFVGFLTNEVSEKRKQKHQTRFDLSTQILEILNEGSNKNWKRKPADSRHVNFLSRQIEIEDKKLTKQFNSLISAWNLCAEKSTALYAGAFAFEPSEKQRLGWKEDEKFLVELQRICSELDKEITEIIKKWRK